MDKERSGPAAAVLHPSVAPLSVLAGWAAMFLVSAAAAQLALGLRPTLIAAEIGLASPALLAALWAAPRQALGLNPAGWRASLVALASGAALWAASMGLLELQYVVWPPPPGYLEQFHQLHETLRPRHAGDAALSVAAIAVAPAVCEELLFRGLALPALMPALGTTLAVAVSSLLFGVIHLDFSGGSATLYRVPFAILVGAGFALLRLRGRSLVPAMLAHGLLNAITFALALQTPLPAELPPPRPMLGAGLLLGGVALQAWLLRLLPR